MSTNAIQRHTSHLIAQTVVAGVIGTLIMVFGMSALHPSLMHRSGQNTWFVIGLITLSAMYFSGRHFYKNAFNAFINHHATMDTLIAVGTIAAWSYSMIITISPHIMPSSSPTLYFETALIIIALVNLGTILEERAKGKTNDAIKRLIGLQPKTAKRINANGIEEIVPIHDLKINDMIRVHPGEKIPVDGIIIEGTTTINEAMLTGESMPVHKDIGDTVFAATINKYNSVKFKATQIGEQTALAQIIALVKKAQSTKPPVARLVDTASSFFVPLVLIIAIITALIWYNLGYPPSFILNTTMSVLIIACPCALGLATPISVIVGMGKAAENGILIRNGIALQKASKISTVVFDKTGTITQGRPQVMQIISNKPFRESEVLQKAASIEKYSEHPLGHAINNFAKAKKIKLVTAQSFSAEVGMGAQAYINNERIIVGNLKFLEKNKINLNIDYPNQGQTPVFVAVADKLMGIIIISDPIKDGVRAAINKIKNLAINVLMISGDNQMTARNIANLVNIDKVLANKLPADKAKEIKKLQSQNVVAMVGDGINDAPALTQADIGFAIGAGTDVAIESADITLIGDSINGVVNAVFISKATMRNIKQNLFGAFIYNIIGIPIAAGVLYPFIGVLLNPMIAGIAMAASSFTVVSNANRLRLFKIDS